MTVSVIRNSVIMTNIAIARKVVTTKNVAILRKVGFTTVGVGKQENKWCQMTSFTKKIAGKKIAQINKTNVCNKCPVGVLHVCELFLPTKISLKIVITMICYDDQCTHDKHCFQTS